MQFFVPFHQADVVTIQQPVDLFAGQRHDFVMRTRPTEFLFGQRLVVQHEAVVFPHQQLDLVALPVGEGIEAAVEWIVSELLFDDGS